MKKVSCNILVNSLDRHVQHLLTGFASLHRNRDIELRQTTIPPPPPQDSLPHHLKEAWKCHLKLILNDTIQVFYDCHDSWELDAEGLDSDVYFKRTYVPEKHDDIANVFPLGLYHPVYSDGLDMFAHRRQLSLSPGIGKIINTLKCLDTRNLFHFAPNVSFFQPSVDVDAPPKVIFMARVWDPADSKGRPMEKQEDRMRINECRVDLVRALGKEFGSDFIGGLAHTKYAQEHFEDCLLPHADDSRARHYFTTLKTVPIGVASKGLHGSVGAKFSEYVALGKAIVSEPLGIDIPGDFSKDNNYLEFNTPDECIAQVHRLFDDHSLRQKLMENNAAYYERYLRPDRLVANSLDKALAVTDGS